MAISFQDKYNKGSSSSNPVVAAFTVQSGCRVLVLSVQTNNRNTVSGTEARAGGLPSIQGHGDFYQVGTAQHSGRADYAWVELFYFLDPPTGAINVEIPNTQDVTTTICAQLAAFSADSVIFLSETSQNSGLSAEPSSTISKDSSETIIIHSFCRFASSYSVISQTGINLYSAGLGNSIFGVQYQTGSGGDTACSYTLGASSYWASIAAEFAETPGIAGTSATTLDDITQTAAGTVVSTNVVGASATTLAGVTQAAAGTVLDTWVASTTHTASLAIGTSHQVQTAVASTHTAALALALTHTRD